jgi:hypothetical protein
MAVVTDVALALVRVLFFLVFFFAWGPLMNSSKSPDGIRSGQVRQEKEYRPNSGETGKAKPVLELIRAWCSAYSQMDSRQMASLETNDVEIVDGFGELHLLTTREGRESFWADGFEMIEPKQFRPQCTFQHIQLLDPEAAVVQIKVRYPQGIELKGHDKIQPFVEVHTFIVTESQQHWLINADILVRQQQEE